MDQSIRDIAAALDVTEEAVSAIHQSDAIDLHIDTFIPMRLWGYDPSKRHGLGMLRGRFGGHLDLPRMNDAGITGAMWSVTTNPFRSAAGRLRTAKRNFAKMREMVARVPSMEIVASYADYQRAKQAGKHAVFPVIQGGNALDGASEEDFLPDPDLVRVTLVHLTNSLVGQSSNPTQVTHPDVEGLTAHGKTLLKQLNQRRVFVDLAHISKQGFWDAVEVHDASQPFLVTHTGVEGVRPHWRNLDDAQIKACAASGGCIGIIFSSLFLRPRGMKNNADLVLAHMEHVIDVAGEDHVSLGSDYDGAITPPKDLRSGDSYPRLVEGMLRRGWSTTRIEKVLGGNFLRALKELRG